MVFLFSLNTVSRETPCLIKSGIYPKTGEAGQGAQWPCIHPAWAVANLHQQLSAKRLECPSAGRALHHLAFPRHSDFHPSPPPSTSDPSPASGIVRPPQQASPGFIIPSHTQLDSSMVSSPPSTTSFTHELHVQTGLGDMATLRSALSACGQSLPTVYRGHRILPAFCTLTSTIAKQHFLHYISQTAEPEMLSLWTPTCFQSNPGSFSLLDLRAGPYPSHLFSTIQPHTVSNQKTSDYIRKSWDCVVLEAHSMKL